MKLEDFIGKTFRRLTVLGIASPNPNRDKSWECLCECGNITFVTTANLKSGTKSCGCWQKDHPYMLGRKHSLETRRKISINNNSLGHTGKKHSKEAIAKMSMENHLLLPAALAPLL